MQESPFILKRSIGEEHYSVEEASWSIYEDKDLKMNNLCICVTAKDLLKTPEHWVKEEEDDEFYGEHPDWELNYVAKDITRESLVKGLKLEIPEGWVDDLKGWITNFYYYEHEGADKNTIELLDVDGDRMYLRMRGETPDYDYNDGSTNTILMVEAWFSYNERAKRSME